MRIRRNFFLDRDKLGYIHSTKGQRSTSDRLNELLKRAILQERYDKLEAEAAVFFAILISSAIRETKTFQKADLETLL